MHSPPLQLLTHLGLPSRSSPRAIYVSLLAPSLCLPVFLSVKACVTKFKSPAAAHSLILSHSLQCAPSVVLPFHSQSVFYRADSEITV